ncbi:MAG: carbohydrate ABC transporter permease [Clostridiales bacterium]|jgi:putative aldouronate transport system permease protein|nr:carbohydrate ABC transporter permease [Clostridiales bacterium]
MKNRISGAFSDRVFDAAVFAVLLLLLLLVAYPLYFTVIASVSAPSDVAFGRVVLFPKNIGFEGYQKVVEYGPIWTGYRNTILYTVAYTLISVIVTMMAGYALSRKSMPFRGFIMAFMTFTMFFSGGQIPTYLFMQQLGLIGNPLLIVVMGTVSVYNTIIARTFMSSSIPDELYEAATIDGCNHARFFVRMVVPLSPALISVLVLFAAVAQWNSWFNAMIYLKEQAHMPLSLVLRDLIVSQQGFMREMSMDSGGDDFTRQAMLAESMKYAVIIVSTLPILCLYPFVQKYFVKGVMVGSIKG